MLHLLLLRYTVPRDDTVGYWDSHAAYLRRWHDAGLFVAAGQTVPDDVGGAVIAVGDRADVDKAIAEDPFVLADVARYEVLTIEPSVVGEELAALLTPPEEFPWDRSALRALRSDGTDLTALFADRPIEPVLQSAGETVLRALAHGDRRPGMLARRCVAALGARGWTGDEELAAELRSALGDDRTETLRALPVDLSVLAVALDGDPDQGHGKLDLTTGIIYEPGTLDLYGPAELDDDPDRFANIYPDSHEAYGDMDQFASDITDRRMRQRLSRALQGRGAFRRFRDAIYSEERYLAGWEAFRDERALGRARHWLAEKGYRPDHDRRGPAY